MRKIRAIIIGVGNRGTRYAALMAQMPDKYQVVAVADPSPNRQKYVRELFNLSEDACYSSWQEILAQPKLADVAVISTVDNMHYYPALQAIEKGYNLLLEKPIAQTVQECVDIAIAAQKNNVSVLVCHVLRYTPFYGKIKELLMSGIIGDVISVDAVEGIGNVHYSHSYVRGNWHKFSESNSMLMAKSCHDLDIIQWLLDKPCKRVQSFGSLTHFIPQNAPAGAPIRCSDGNCPVGDTCPYNCIHHYYDDKTNRRRGIITNGISADFIPTDEDVLHALKTRDYGLCVYHANNDVVDHQTVNMEFEGGVTASLSVNAFNAGGRYIRLFGTKGELYAFMKNQEITVYTFEDKQHRFVSVPKVDETINGGHGGGDEGIVKELYEYLNDNYSGFRACDISVSVKNHIIGFAAEEARLAGTVIDINSFEKKYGF